MSAISLVTKEIPAAKIEEQNKLEKNNFDSYLALRTMQLNGASPEDLHKAYGEYFKNEEAALAGRVSIKPHSKNN